MRVKLMPKYLPIYEHEWSIVPDKIRISTEDGHVLDYVSDGRQQKSSVLAGLLDKFNNTVFGGQKK